MGIAHATRFALAVKTLCGLSVWARSRGSPSGTKSADRSCDFSPSSFRNVVFFRLLGLTGLHQRPLGMKFACATRGLVPRLLPGGGSAIPRFRAKVRLMLQGKPAALGRVWGARFLLCMPTGKRDPGP